MPHVTLSEVQQAVLTRAFLQAGPEERRQQLYVMGYQYSPTGEIVPCEED